MRLLHCVTAAFLAPMCNTAESDVIAATPQVPVVVIEESPRPIFDQDGMATTIRDVATHFGVPSFEYLVWAINNNFQDVLLDISDRNNVTETHFDYLVNTTLEAEIEAACEESSVPLATIKQGVVGVLITESTNSIYKRAAKTLEEILGQVVLKIIELDSSVDVEELNRKVAEALELLKGDEV